MKTSNDWYNELILIEDIVIMDPDGWDRRNFKYSFYEELITQNEFNNRLMQSTVIRNKSGLTKKQYVEWKKLKTYEGFLTKQNINGGIFVFGSNTQGRHGKGNALVAKNEFGAIYGQAKGRQGNSYGIVTTDLTTKIRPSVSINYIIEQIIELYEYAEDNTDLNFYIGYSGKGLPLLSGFDINELAEMFAAGEPIPNNIIFEKEFSKLVIKHLYK